MDSLRIDKWLWFARFCKTRSLAQHLLEGGEVSLNGRRVDRPSVQVKPGDEVIFPLGRGMRRVRIVALGSRRGPAPAAQALYDELPPPPPPPDEGLPLPP